MRSCGQEVFHTTELQGLGAEKDFAVHQLGHELSAKFDIAHGASLSAVWGAWATYVYDANQPDLRSMQEESGM